TLFVTFLIAFQIVEKVLFIVFSTPLIMENAAFKTLDIMFLIPFNKLDAIFFIVSQAPLQSPVTICIPIFMMPFIKSITVVITDLITSHTADVMFFTLSQAVFIIGTIISIALITIA